MLVATPSRRHARARRRRPPVDQPAADRARPAGPQALRAGLRRRAGGDDGGRLPADRSDPDGESDYLRLTTRSIAQVERADDGWKAGALAGGYWLREPAPGAEAAIVSLGAIMPEALAAWEALSRRRPRPRPARRHLARPAPPRLERAAQAARWAGRARRRATSRQLLAPLAPGAGLVTLLDGAPASLVLARRRRSASGSARSASTGSARPATSPTSTPPTGSTARRSPRRLPRCCSPLLNPGLAYRQHGPDPAGPTARRGARPCPPHARSHGRRAGAGPGGGDRTCDRAAVVDIVGQMLGHIANVVRRGPPGAVERIGMCELKAKLGTAA